MERADCHFKLMDDKRAIYLEKLLKLAGQKGFTITPFEQEEIEEAFEAGFVAGFNQGAKRRNQANDTRS